MNDNENIKIEDGGLTEDVFAAGASAPQNAAKIAPRKRIALRVVCLVLCAALFAAAFTLPHRGGGEESSSSSQSVPSVPASAVAAAYKEKQSVLKADGAVALVVPADEPSYSDKLKKQLKKYGLSTDVFTWEEAEEDPDAVFNYYNYRAVIYADAGGVPEGLIHPIAHYLRQTGGLICLGGPAFSDIYSKSASGYVKTRLMTATNDADQNNQYSAELLVDCLSPAYQTYPVTNAARVVSRDSQGILPQADYVMPSDMFSPSPRTYGTGILKNRNRRFIPLIEALDEKGETAGYPAYMLLSAGVEEQVNYAPGMWAAFNTNDAAFLGSDETVGAIACVAAYFNIRTLFYGGGATEYTYFPGDEWTVGAETLSDGMLFGESVDQAVRPARECTVKLTVEANGSAVFEKEFQPYEFTSVSDTALGTYTLFTSLWTPREAGDYRVTAELRSGAVTLDRLTHEVGVYVEKPASERSYVTAEGNDLYLDGEVFKCFGVNYMPSTGIALVGDDYEKWVSPSAFDIDVVSKDLRRIKDIGFNAVSVFAYDVAIGDNTLLTLLRLCERYGLKAFLSFREFANPVYFNGGNEQKIRDMIAGSRLAESDALIGYDVSWETMPGGYEPSWCNAMGMMSFDDVWTKWVRDNYGSLEAAEEAWGWSPGRTAGGGLKGVDIAYVADRRVTQASKALLAYRRWLDDWCADIYGKVADIIKDADPYHLVSARNGMYTGWPNGRFRDVGWEYGALASALDVMGPEGYGYYYKWDDDFETAVYSVAYSRYSCEKPLIWFEFGKSAWTGSNYDNTRGLEMQADYISNINRVLTDSQSNGVFYWWYAGGFRLNEASDYGIINPDGSDRPATTLLRDFADGFKNGGRVREPDVVMTAGRDEYTYGVVSMYFEHQSDFKKANSEGKIFGIASRADKMTSLDAELSRIGDLDAGPLRFLNSSIRKVEYRVEGGEWAALENGGVVSAPRGSRIELRVTAVNTGRAKWICRANAGASAGAVCVNADGASFDTPSDVGRHGIVTVSGVFVTADRYKTVKLEMAAEGRAHFGEKISFTVKTV